MIKLAAVMRHFSKDFAVGVAGYHYEQVTGDSGAGAVLGDFKGRVSAIGPNLTYIANTRLEGDAVIATLTIPLGGTPAH